MSLTNKLLLTAIVLTILVSSVPQIREASAQEQKIYVALVWHYHQPWYYNVNETMFVLPWVRMHSVGNYYKMAYILSKYSGVRATFTFSGSLLEQLIDIIQNRKKDLRWIISEKIVNGTVTERDVFEMLKIPGGFFDINWARIVDRTPRFSELRSIAQSAFRECAAVAVSEEELVKCVVNRFTTGNLLGQRVVDLAVLFNLLWIDPQVARELYPGVYGLIERARREQAPFFTREELRQVLSVHYDIISKVPGIYRELINRNQIELIPVPYSHPLSPIIADLGFAEDLEIHIRKSVDLFDRHFNTRPRGVWPAEQAVNEQVVEAFSRAGITWTITDQSILAGTGVNANDINNLGVPWYIDFRGSRIYVVFRDTELSNLISFSYSGWRHGDAVNDLINRIMGHRGRAAGPRLVVIALDGENPWEHYEEFGTLFLNELYRRLSELQNQGVLETITPGDFINRFSNVARELPIRSYTYLDLANEDISNLPRDSYGDAYADLPRRTVSARLPEGSWAGGELAIWIGHRQENVALMWLAKARSEILRHLGFDSFAELYEGRPDIASYLLKAEASDWWWWYGDDGGGSPQTFDPLFKAYLRRAYELAGLTPPDYLSVYAYPDGTPIGTLNANVPLPTSAPPKIDGVIEGAWTSEVANGKGLKVVVGSIVSAAYLLFDENNLYLAFNATPAGDLRVGVYFNSPAVSLSPYSPEYNVYPRNSRADLSIYLVREILVDVRRGRATVSRALGRGEWGAVSERDAFAFSQGGVLNVELAVPWSDLELPRGIVIHLAVVAYVGGDFREHSSRLGLAYQMQIPRGAAAGRVIFEMEDPRGDDDGAGGLRYPTNPVFQRGVFDLVRFRVTDAGDRIVFSAYFDNLGGNPWRGPNGWSMQQIHIYIHTTTEDPGRTDTIALNAVVSREHSWHMAILLAPGWRHDPGPLPRGQMSAIYYYDQEQPLVQDGGFKVYADLIGGAIIAEVSKRLLYDVENVEEWTYVVAVTSHDGYGTNMIRSFVVGDPEEWKIGVPPQYALAVLNNVFPFILDVLAPTAEEQYSMLRSFNADTGQLAVIRGYGKRADRAITPTPTPTTPAPTSTAEAPRDFEFKLEYAIFAAIAAAAAAAIVFIVKRRR